MIPKSRKILYVCMTLLIVAGQIKLHVDRKKRIDDYDGDRLTAQAMSRDPRPRLAAPRPPQPRPETEVPVVSSSAVETLRVSSHDDVEESLDVAAPEEIGCDTEHPQTPVSWPADPFWPRDDDEHETKAGGDSVAPATKLGDMIPVMEEDSAAVGRDVHDTDDGPGSTKANGRAMSVPSEGGE